MIAESLTLRAEFLPQKGQSTGDAPPAGVTGPAGAGPAETGGTPGTVDPNGAPGGAPRQQDPMKGCYESLPMILLMVGVFYFLLIRPQQKQEKQRKEMVSALKKGDAVVMNSGMHGIVEELTEKTVRVRVDSNVVLMFDRGSIQRSESLGGEDAGQKAS